MQKESQQSPLLESRPHFEILNGLRGLAAVVVLVFHFMEIIFVLEDNFISHGYLAVDFFFCLSGFVIAYAYDNRIAGMGFKTFIQVRLIRLQPLVVIGSVLGLLTFLFNPYVDLYAVYGLKETALLFITSVFMIPYPVVSERYFNLFNLNAPSWTLFWEYFANFIYVAILFKASKKVLTTLALGAATALFYIAWQHGNLLGGWDGSTFFHGLARIAFSFSMGMLICRSKWIIKNKLGLLGMSALLMLAFLTPHVDEWNRVIEPVLVVFYLPLLVSLGAGASLSSKHHKINKLSGEISYPLYMTHYPFMWIFGSYVAAVNPSSAQLWRVIPVSILLLIGFAYLVSKYVDSPVRRYLSDKVKAGLNRKYQRTDIKI